MSRLAPAYTAPPARRPAQARLGGWLSARRWPVRLAFTAALTLVGTPPWTPRAVAGPQEEIFRRDYAISGFKLPPRWDARPRDRASYPQLLAWAGRGQGTDQAIITLVGKRLPPHTTMAAFVDETLSLKTQPRVQNLRLLPQRAAGWFGGMRMQVDAQLAPSGTSRAQVLRQYMFMNPPFGYVLTLVAPAEQAAARYRDLEDTADSLAPLQVSDALPLPPPVGTTPPPPTTTPPAVGPPAQPGAASAPTQPSAGPTGSPSRTPPTSTAPDAPPNP